VTDTDCEQKAGANLIEVTATKGEEATGFFFLLKKFLHEFVT
jgi:hypothetical protein